MDVLRQNDIASNEGFNYANARLDCLSESTWCVLTLSSNCCYILPGPGSTLFTVVGSLVPTTNGPTLRHRLTGTLTTATKGRSLLMTSKILLQTFIISYHLLLIFFSVVLFLLMTIYSSLFSRYVVYEGKNPGVYDQWRDAHQQVAGYPDNSYERVKGADEAKSRFNDYNSQKWRSRCPCRRYK